VNVQGLRLVIAAFVAAASLAGVLTWRAHNAAQRTTSFCVAIHKLDVVLQSVVTQPVNRRSLVQLLTKLNVQPDRIDAIADSLIKQSRKEGSRRVALLKSADCDPNS